ncbi:MAG: hemerythrin family protein [Gammaproteobacteria bacterium]|nr:hemerythrin family protein [Gammaproteobacteria bacterium]
MHDSPATQAAAESQQTLDNEHLVQLGLADAVVQSVEEGASAEEVQQLVAQFVDYTELHFMSEQLLMRLHAYPDYDEHVADHEAIVEALRALRESTAGGEASPLTAERAHKLKGQMLGHIRNRDAALHAFIDELKHGN